MPMRAVFKTRRKDNIFVNCLPSVNEAIEIMGGLVPAEDVDWPAAWWARRSGSGHYELLARAFNL